MFSSLVKKPVIKNVIVALKNLLVTPRYKTGSIDASNALSRNVSVNVAVSNAVQRKSAGVVAVRMDETVCFFFSETGDQKGTICFNGHFRQTVTLYSEFSHARQCSVAISLRNFVTS